MPQLGRGFDLLHVVAHVGEDPIQVQFLLVARAARGDLGLSHDGKHGNVIEFGVVQPREHVSRAGTAGRQAHPEFTRRLRVADRHECGHLLVADLDELDTMPVFLGPLQSAEHAVDAIP